MKDNRFYPQVELMLSILSDVMAESCFALKGGTAINLFVRDMPRLSVDIDLTYLPLRGRDESLEGISNALERIASRIVRHRPATEIHKSFAPGGRRIVKLVVSQPGAHVKVEPNTILRGTVFPCQEAQLCAAACQEFRLDAQVRTVSLPDLYGGKICAALDRQHPRDFFDVMLLLANEGLTDAIRSAFVIYLASCKPPKKTGPRANLDSALSIRGRLPISRKSFRVKTQPLIRPYVRLTNVNSVDCIDFQPNFFQKSHVVFLPWRATSGAGASMPVLALRPGLAVQTI